MNVYRVKKGPLIGPFRTEREAVAAYFNTQAIALLPIGWLDCASGKIIHVEAI